MDWHVFPLESYPSSLWDDWKSLVVEHHKSNPMLDANFVSLLVAYYGKDVFVAKGMVGTQLNALLLLQNSGLGRWRLFKPSQAQIALFACSQNQAVSVNKLISAIPGYCIKLDLFGLDPNEHATILQELLDKQVYATNIHVNFSSDFEDYWTSRSKNLRKNINRYINRLKSDECVVEYQDVVVAPDCLAAVDRYGMLESQGWKGVNGTSLHPANTQGQLYREFIEVMAGTGKCLIYETYLNQELVASRLCVYSEDKFVILKTTFNEDLKKYALGRLNLHSLLEYIATNLNVKQVDFYTNASKEQKDWSTDQCEMYNASMYRNAVIRVSVKLASTMKKQFKKILHREIARDA